MQQHQHQHQGRAVLDAGRGGPPLPGRCPPPRGSLEGNTAQHKRPPPLETLNLLGGGSLTLEHVRMLDFSALCWLAWHDRPPQS